MQVTIEKLVYGGAGLARTDQGVIFVDKTAPGDVVEIDIVERKKQYSVGQLRHIAAPSPVRRPPTCANFESVGCCHWDHILYDRQVEYKIGIIQETLARVAHIADVPQVTAITGPEHGYRMRATFHLSRGAFGFVRQNSNTIVPITECAALAPQLNRFIPSATALRLPATRADVLTNGLEIAAAFQIDSRDIHPPFEKWRDALFEITGVSDVTFFFASKHVHYSKHVPELTACGNRYRLTPETFFQANRFLLEKFVGEVVAAVGPSPRNVLDLYSGSGLFSIAIARQ